MCRLSDQCERQRLRRYGLVVALPIVSLILTLTLYPFDFNGGWPTQPLAALMSGQSHLVDVLRNVALFAPLGIGLRWLLAGIAIGPRGQVVGAMLLAGLLALIIELVQLSIPGRTATLIDVLANAAGAGLGSTWLARPVASVIDLIGKGCLTLVQRVPAWAVAIGLGGWVTGSGWLLAHWQQATLPVNWSERHSLQIGAASDGRRFWPGYVSFIALYNRALSVSEAGTVLNFSTAVALQPLLAYDLTQAPPVMNGPMARPLLTRGRPVVTAEGTGVGYQRWLTSGEPLPGVPAAIAQARALTLVAQVAPRSPERMVEGLIINYGRQIDNHNISLIQFGPDLLVRIRLPWTRAANDRPSLRFRNVFHDQQPRVLVLSYDGAEVRLFIDGQPHHQRYVIGPGEVLINRWIPVQPHQIGGWSIALTAVLSVPLALIGAPWRGSRQWLVLPVLAGPLVMGWVPGLVIAQPLSGALTLSSALTALVGSLVIVWLTKPFASGSRI